MLSLKNSYPKRAYRRKQRSLKARRRLALTRRTYDPGYTYYEKEDGTIYVVRRAYYRNLKRECKNKPDAKLVEQNLMPTDNMLTTVNMIIYGGIYIKKGK